MKDSIQFTRSSHFGMHRLKVKKKEDIFITTINFNVIVYRSLNAGTDGSNSSTIYVHNMAIKGKVSIVPENMVSGSYTLELVSTFYTRGTPRRKQHLTRSG